MFGSLFVYFGCKLDGNISTLSSSPYNNNKYNVCIYIYTVITTPTNHKWNVSSHQSGKQPTWNSHSKTPARGEGAETVTKIKSGVSNRIYPQMWMWFIMNGPTLNMVGQLPNMRV